MPLPFLKPKSVAGVIISKRKPDGGPEEQHTEGEEYQGLESCADEIIRAINAKDSKALAAAFKDAFEICESYPHEESDETPSPHTYDAQNEKAVKYSGENQ